MKSNEEIKPVTKWNGWGYTDTQFFIKDDTIYFKGNKRYSIGTGDIVRLPHFKPWANAQLNLDFNKPISSLEVPPPLSYPDSRINQEGHEGHVSFCGGQQAVQSQRYPIGFYTLPEVPEDPCLFCTGAHYMHLCPSKRQLYDRRKSLQDRSLCLRCFARHLPTEKHKSRFEKYCKWFDCVEGDHATALCPRQQYPISRGHADAWHLRRKELAAAPPADIAEKLRAFGKKGKQSFSLNNPKNTTDNSPKFSCVQQDIATESTTAGGGASRVPTGTEEKIAQAILPNYKKFDASQLSPAQKEALPKMNFLTLLQSEKIDYTIEGEERLRRSHCQTLSDIFALRQRKIPERIPDIVVWPKSHENVKTIVELAVNHNIVIIPFGGGTSVSGSSTCPTHEPRVIIALDTSQMVFCCTEILGTSRTAPNDLASSNRLLWLNEENLTACFEAGVIGQHLENILQSKGFTCGHEPDSYEFSSLGGWVATRASGMKKNVYGNIEDIMLGFRMVTPNGVLERRCEIPRMSCGPDFMHLVLGSEGTLGVITEVTIKIRPVPPVKKYNSFVFRNFESGLKCMREIARQRCQPASVRLMDNPQFQIGQALRLDTGILAALKDKLKNFYLYSLRSFDVDSICVMTLFFEGQSAEDINNNLKKITKIAQSVGGICAGENNGKLGYNLTFVIAYIRDLAFNFKVVGESFETAVPWDKTLAVCTNVKKCLENACKEYSIKHSAISYRVTQTYDSGCCIYFYFIFNWENIEHPVETFDRIEAMAREEILKSGGSLSHHHGIGKIRSQFYRTEVTDYGVDLYKAMKQFVDPQNIFGVGNFLCHM